ncbi:MAG TPA: hypothetical protein VGP19_11805 [Candidatus Acidoferrales bacterium]|jgi:hypothetical protein|nr:hypothetical protein [Candidatus Acidoferrales bacterium]
MRSLSKAFIVAVGLLAIGLASSSAGANDVLVGNFTLPHSTEWNNTVLPAGDYTFKVARTQTNADLLMIRGAKQSVSLYIYAESACTTCQSSSLNLAVRGNNRVVTSLDLTGFHVNFKVRQSAAEGEEMSRVPASTEQVAVHVDPN